MTAKTVDLRIGGRSAVVRHSWWLMSAVLAALLTFGCARPIDLANSNSPDSELAALVDSDAARRLHGVLKHGIGEGGGQPPRMP